MGYSKNRWNQKKMIKIMFGIFLLLFLISGITLIILRNTESVVVEKKDISADHVSDDIARNAMPIIIDNIVVGATYNKQFVSADRYFSQSSYKANTEMNAYTSRGKSGTFTIKEMKKTTQAILATLNNSNLTEEYFAISSSDKNAMPILSVERNVSDEDYQYARMALGKYRLLDTTMKITKVYDVSINLENSIRILCVTSNGGKNGVYNAILFVNANGTKSKIIKYYYSKETKNLSEWPLYSFEFVADLNGDGNSELILREVKEFEVTYTVLEYRESKNRFEEVLSSTVKMIK